MPYKDPEKERACGRRRYERITADRITSGLCPRCGKARPAPDRTLCRHCGEKRRKAERARCAKAKSAGILYGNAEKCLMPSDLQESADPRGFSTDSLGINPGRYLPPVLSFSLFKSWRTTNVFDTQTPASGDHSTGWLRPDHPCVHRRSPSPWGDCRRPRPSLSRPCTSLSDLACALWHSARSGREHSDRSLSAARLRLL